MSDKANMLFEAIAAQIRHSQGIEVDDETVEALLRNLTRGVVAAINPARHASITLVEGGNVLSVAPTSSVALRLDELQTLTSSGPCLEAAWNEGRVVVDDYTTDPRWPAYQDRAVRTTGVRSSVCIELYRHAGSMGALNVHADQPGAFHTHSIAVVQTYAAQATTAVRIEVLEKQFAAALASRDIIGQAKGILMERYDADADAAFNLLCKLSQDTNVKLATIARRLVQIEHPTPDPQPVDKT